MKKELYRKIIALVLLFIFVFPCASQCVIAAINEDYSENTQAADYDTNKSTGVQVFAKIILPVVFPIFVLFQTLTMQIMKMITGQYFFPWEDKIIFNTVPVLDVNFLNPAKGSLFLKSDGVTYTAIGQAYRGLYFTVLSICVGFLGVAVVVNAIKMVLSQIASAKARYKEMINNTLLTLVLLFGMHYIMAFTFYLNEQLVTVASKIVVDSTSEASKKISKQMDEEYDKDSEQILENFYKACNKTSLANPVVLVKKIFKEGVNLLALGLSKLKNSINNFWNRNNNNSDDNVTLGEDETNNYYDEVFPSKNDIINYFSDESKVGPNGEKIAAYLVRQYDFRSAVLVLAAGNNANSFGNSGVWGPVQSILNTAIWVTGILDTGLNALQNLYSSTYFVYNNARDTYGIYSTQDYYNAIEDCNTIIHDDNSTDDDIKVARLKVTLINAYYKYVYDGDDKEEIKSTNVISSLGEYFYENAYYVDVKKGQWSPETFNITIALLYCIFVLQSVIFLFSYIKRLFGVLILALFGPATVVLDYIKKSY